jgi:hypothetical protein
VIMSRLSRLEIGRYFGSLTEEYERVWRNPLFEPPPLHIFHQEERIEESENIREVEEKGVEEREGEYKSEGETKVNNTLQGRASVSIIASSQSGRHSSRSSMVNQDTTLRLPTLHGMGRDDMEQHWFNVKLYGP